LLKVRFYPVSTTEFTPTTPSNITEIHLEDAFDGHALDGDVKLIVITGGTANPGVSIHDSAIVAAGTGPNPRVP